MPNLNVDLNFPDHPKTKRLAALIGRDPEAMLLRIWCYCGKYHTDSGRLEGLSTQEVEALAGWRGKPGAMCEAMTRTKWLEMDGGTYVVHDWREHQGHLQAYKERGKMMANRRWGRPPDAASNACSNAASIASSNAPAVPANQPVHPPPPNARAQEVSDVPDKAQAITQATMQAIDPEFAGYVFDDWEGRSGCDAANIPVPWIRYAVKRWNRERKEWTEGTHRGRKLDKAAPAVPQGGLYALQRQLELVERELKEIRGRATETGLSTIFQPQDIPRRAHLLAQKKQLKEQLGLTAPQTEQGK